MKAEWSSARFVDLSPHPASRIPHPASFPPSSLIPYPSSFASMPLTINLLHEQQFLLKQRQRDPLKLGFYALGGVAALFILYYGARFARSSALASNLRQRQAVWAKQEPAAQAAETQEKEASGQVASAALVTKRIDGRFYWAPLLETLLKAVPSYVQIVNLTGSNETKADKIDLTLEGIVAGDVPRLVADKFRGELTAALTRVYPGVETSFRGLEENATTVNVNGKAAPTARFTIEIKMPKPGAEPTATPEPARPKRH